MPRFRYREILCVTGLLLSGCSSVNGPTQHEKATQEWNAARASALAALAADQYQQGNFDKCDETLAQALALQPDNIDMRLLAAKLALEQGKLEYAEAHLAIARTKAPKNATADYLTGIVYQRWQQFDKARDEYTEAAKKNPAEVSYVLAAAEMSVALGKPDLALQQLRAALPYFEHSAPLRDEIGLLLTSKKQYGEAATALQEACRLATDDAMIREHLAFALFFDKRYAEADLAFDRIAGLPDYETRADVQAALAECQAQIGQFANAQRNYQAAIDLDTANAGYWLGLSKATLQLGDLPGADVSLRKSLSINANSSEAHCLLGYLRLKQNRPADAMDAFRKASQLDPHDSVSLCLQGYLLARMNRNAEARAMYVRALQVDPTNKLASDLFQVAMTDQD